MCLLTIENFQQYPKNMSSDLSFSLFPDAPNIKVHDTLISEKKRLIFFKKDFQKSFLPFEIKCSRQFF